MDVEIEKFHLKLDPVLLNRIGGEEWWWSGMRGARRECNGDTMRCNCRSIHASARMHLRQKTRCFCCGWWCWWWNVVVVVVGVDALVVADGSMVVRRAGLAKAGR
jgi:hypothetical protein